MKILITGATGFLGRALIHYIEKNDYDKENDIILVTSAEKVNMRYKCIIHNNHRISSACLSEVGPIDAVIHLGGGVPTQSEKISVNDLNLYIENINSTYDLLLALSSTQIPKVFLFASSVMVYDTTNNAISESTTVNPAHPYGMSKKFCEFMIIEWAKENDVLSQILRIGQCYGAGEESGLLLPKLIDCAIQNKKFSIFSDGSERRSFIHSEDVARGIWNAIELRENHIINLVGAKSYSVKEIAEMVFDIEGKNNCLSIINGNYPTRNFIYDVSLMHKYLGEEKINFLDGIRSEYKYRKSKIGR